MNFERRLKRLNNKFGEAFGFGPLGPKYQWIFTPDCSYWMWRRDSLVQLPQSRNPDGTFAAAGLFVPSPQYERLSWADRIGVRWVLSVWKMPVSETEWTDKHGYSVPWPAKGEMQLIENIVLDVGPPAQEPDDDLTEQAIWAVRKDLEKSFADFKEQGDKILADQHREAKRLIDDEIDDMDLYHIPGTRGGDRLIFTSKD